MHRRLRRAWEGRGVYMKCLCTVCCGVALGQRDGEERRKKKEEQGKEKREKENREKRKEKGVTHRVCQCPRTEC